MFSSPSSSGAWVAKKTHLVSSASHAHASFTPLFQYAFAELVESLIKACLIGARTCGTRVRQQFLDQLWAITCRVRNAPTSRVPSLKAWSIGFATCAAGLKNIGHNDSRVRNEAKLFCTVPGCKTLGPAATLCGRCKTPYCSQQCQKQYVLSQVHTKEHEHACHLTLSPLRDWHIHKQSCAKPKKESR